MLYTPRKTRKGDPDGQLFETLEPVIRGLGMSLIELDLYRSKGRSGNPGNINVRAVVYREGTIGLEDCSRVHHAIMPRLELAFPGQDIYLEVSSPGIERLIKDGSEFAHYIGRFLRCYRIDISAWTTGILLEADEEKILLRTEDGEAALAYGNIAKARLCDAPPEPEEKSKKRRSEKKGG